MGKPYSLDLRERVVAALEAGLSTGQAATRFSIGKATAGAWGRLKRAQGDVRPAQQCNPKGSGLDARADFILGATRCSPDPTPAQMVRDGPMDAEGFRAWCEQMLAPVLRPGHLVIMDNLAAHKVAGVRQAIEACGATLLYLPPYSPDLNPIENAFAKLKAHIRKAAARTIEALQTATADALQTFKPVECENFFAHAGYGFD